MQAIPVGPLTKELNSSILCTDAMPMRDKLPANGRPDWLSVNGTTGHEAHHGAASAQVALPS
jgi:hypothetical protein